MRPPSLLSLTFTLVIPLTLAACSDPCEKAYKRTVECTSKEGIKKSVASRKELILRLCAPFKNEVEACVEKESCVAFSTCMKRVTTPLRAHKKSTRNRQVDEAEPQKNEPKEGTKNDQNSLKNRKFTLPVR